MSRPFTEIFGMFPPGEGDVRRVAMTAARAGYAVVPVKPLSKAPICTLNQTERRALKGGRHECGVHHWSLDADRIDRDFKRLTTELHKEAPDLNLNLGVVPGPSRLIMADADTPEAVEAMRQWYDGPPNILTPGVNRDGTWVHKDGGHWYWAVPADLAMPTVKKQRTVDGVDFRWSDNLQALVPPSIRPEGPYICRGDVPEAPQSVLDLIFDWTSTIEVKRAQRLDEATFRNDRVASWSIATPWEELLAADGWDATGKLDPGCGCPEWEKPGGGSSSRRSALAHEGECDKYPNIESHGPLHVFTSDPPEGIARYKEATGATTMTKLQYVAWMHYDGDERAAKVALGLAPDLDEFFTSVGVGSTTTNPPASEGAKPLVDGGLVVGSPLESEKQPTPVLDEVEDDDEVEFEEPSEVVDEADDDGVDYDIPGKVAAEAALVLSRYGILTDARAELLTKNALDALLVHLGRSVADTVINLVEQPVRHEPSLADVWAMPIDDDLPTLIEFEDVDNRALLYPAETNLVFARRGAGKTFFGIHACLEVVDAGGTACYVDLEDTVKRMHARIEGTLGYNLLPAIESGRFDRKRYGAIDTSTMAKMIEELRSFDLVVFDVVSRMQALMGGDVNNANTETVLLFDMLFDPLKEAGVSVLLLAHPNKKGQEMSTPIDQIEPSGGGKLMDNVSGAAYLLVPRRPFSKDATSAEIEVVCKKDRGGTFAENETVGTFASRPSVSEHYGRLCQELYLTTKTTSIEDIVAGVAQRIVEILKSSAVSPVMKKHITPNLSKKQRTFYDAAVATLVLDGRVTEKGAGLVLGEKEK